jgi:DHA1 family bicyclomycin/chloramphenicol resistance-like MFS transporter
MIVSAVFTYMTSSSFLFQEVFGLSPQAYSAIFAVNAVGFVLGSQSASKLLSRYRPEKLLPLTLTSLTALGVGIAVVGMTVSTSPYPLTVLTAAFFIFAGASAPSLGLIAMTPHSLRAGSAAAAMGAVSFGMAGITAPLVGILGGASAAATGLIMAATVGVALGVFIVLIRPSGALPRVVRRPAARSTEKVAEILLRPGSTFRDEVLESMLRGEWRRAAPGAPPLPGTQPPTMTRTRSRLRTWA